MQLKEKPELNQINQKSEASVKTYQPDRPIKEPKSVATSDRTNLQPIKEPKSVAKVDRANLQPIKEPKSVARVDRQDLRSIKNLKSVAKTYQPYLPPIKEHKSGGGTLRIIEFFVVVIIIGILSSIALPPFLSCGNKAKHSEAKQYAGSMNRAQQAYFADKGAFSNSITALGIGIKTQTTNYNYSILATKNAAFSYGVARSNNLHSYVGAILFVHRGDEMTTISILCQANSPGNIQPANPSIQNNVPVCAAGSSVVSK